MALRQNWPIDGCQTIWPIINFRLCHDAALDRGDTASYRSFLVAERRLRGWQALHQNLKRQVTN